MIELKNITKTIGGKVILDNLSLRIDQGDLVAIVGKSGSGKSTLLNLLGLIDGDYSGRYEILERVGLSATLHQRVSELSGGEQQRIAVARAILKPSQLILADEPTGSLDPENRDLVLKFLLEMNREGKTVIIVTHDAYVAQQCHRVIELGEGK
ncbi:amino acid ABC transporter ATP-binding protein [Streptococcus pneumoniae]|nr:amino acid ABC transporter ATP-binding protein [Streptococcus pneumoniae]